MNTQQTSTPRHWRTPVPKQSIASRHNLFILSPQKCYSSQTSILEGTIGCIPHKCPQEKHLSLLQVHTAGVGGVLSKEKVYRRFFSSATLITFFCWFSFSAYLMYLQTHFCMIIDAWNMLNTYLNSITKALMMLSPLFFHLPGWHNCKLTSIDNTFMTYFKHILNIL